MDEAIKAHKIEKKLVRQDATRPAKIEAIIGVYRETSQLKLVDE
jgi:hypothetical protein